MSSNKLKKNYIQKLNALKKHNKLYFEKNSPKISDADFDKLKKEIIEIEKNNPNIIGKFSVSNLVGFKPSKSFDKYTHKVQMLSLSNAFSEEDLFNFEKKIFNF